MEQVLLEVKLVYTGLVVGKITHDTLLLFDKTSPRIYLYQRSDLKNPEVPKFSFGKHKALWHYSTVISIEDEKKGFDK